MTHTLRIIAFGKVRSGFVSAKNCESTQTYSRRGQLTCAFISHQIIMLALKLTCISFLIAFWSIEKGYGEGLANPTLEFKFCDGVTHAECWPSQFGANSTFAFGDTTSATFFFNEKPYAPALSVTCSASEPLRWKVDCVTDAYDVTSIQSVATFGGIMSGLTYRYEIFLNKTCSGRIRCESYETASRAAEIFMVPRDRGLAYLYVNKHLVEFPALPADDSAGLVVPCNFMNFDRQTNFSSVKVLKAPRSQIFLNTPSDDCLKCFPQLAHAQNSKPCTRCGPFGLRKDFWEAANRPTASPFSQLNSKDGHAADDEFIRCALDYNCSARSIKADPLAFGDCNNDGFVTCSDYVTALQAYPEPCVASEGANANYINVEGCLMDRIGTEVGRQDSYDPRFGFRLKGVPDYDAVYMCTGVGEEQIRVHLVPYPPYTRINATLSHVRNDHAQSLDEIVCSVPSWFKGNVNLEMIECTTLSHCELQQRQRSGEIRLRNSPDVLKGVEGFLRNRLSRVIRRPFSHGVVSCHRHYFGSQFGYIRRNAYFFMGLDGNCYFTTDSFPSKAVIDLIPQKRHIIRLGINLNFMCNISSFVLFPTFQLTLEFQNGSNTHDGITVLELVQQEFTAQQKFAIRVTENLTKVSCHAHARNSTKWFGASLSLTEIDQSTISTADSSPYETILVLVGLTGILTALTLIAVFVVIKHIKCKVKNSMERNVLPLESYRDLLASVQDLALPKNFIVPSADLILDTSNVLGQGQFGLCVVGQYQGRDVAVKITKNKLNDHLFQEFLREVKLMASLGRHENIVEFIGAVVDDISERSCKAITELSPYRDLLRFLRHSDITKSDYLETSQKFQIHHLVYFCEQIAAGMEFLNDKHIIHGDLAARNVLVFSDFIVKITDFGLSRKLYNYSANYVKKVHTLLPWRWMAIESLKYLEFSNMSDMWAFGVTVWEIFTLGEVPFAHMRFSAHFKSELENGLRLEQPRLASDDIYHFMMSTWNSFAPARPTFKFGREFFQHVKEDELAKSSKRDEQRQGANID